MNYHQAYLAFLMYCSDSNKNGCIPCRWGTLRDDLKEKWLAKASAKMEAWREEEESAKKRRETDPRAFFCD
jgi:uncharacterized protein YodC (DUF2158 family)